MSALHVVFKVGEVEYVLPAADVVELESFTGATRVPGAPPYVAGLVQIRGKVIAVVDLRTRFGLPPIDRTIDARVIVVRHGERLVGLLADQARDVMKISPDEFRRPPEVVSEETEGFVESIAQPQKRLVMKVDFAKVIGRQELPGA